MNWLKLLFEVASEAWFTWRESRKPDEPIASQRDIAIGVASGEAARREGKRAKVLAAEKRQQEAELEDTWPGERK